MRVMHLVILASCLLLMPACKKTTTTLEELQVKVDAYIADPKNGANRDFRVLQAAENMTDQILQLSHQDRGGLHREDANLTLLEKEQCVKTFFWRKVIRDKDGSLKHLKVTYVSRYGAPKDQQDSIVLEAVDRIPDTTSHHLDRP